MRILLALGIAILSATLASADDDRILMENTKIDGKDVKMVFDSGSSFVGLTSQAVKRLGLKVVVPPTNGLGDTAIYNAEFDGQPLQTDFGILNFPNVEPNFDGLMGWPPLSRAIFRIDAEAEELTFISKVPPGIKQWTQLSIETNAGTLNLEISSKPGDQNFIFVDTGTTFGVELTAHEWKRWKKTHPHCPLTLEGYVTMDGIYAGEESWADKIQIGPLTLYDVPVMEENPAMAKQVGSERDAVGFAALRRLDLVVDGIHSVAYLRAKQTPPSPYSYNRLGAEFFPTAKDSNHLVARVLPRTPAYEAGIRNGDILLKVNGASVGSWTDGWVESDTNTAFSMPAGTKVQLTVQRKKRIFETTAVLREILQPSHRKYEANDDSIGLSELDAEGYFDQGVECESQGDSNGALTNYDKAIKSEPDLGEAYSRRAYLEQLTNGFDAAIADYEKALQLNVEMPVIKANLAIAYANRGSYEVWTNEFDAAIADYEKVLQLKVTFPDVKTNLAQTYVDRGWLEDGTNEFDAAIADFEKALQIKPASPDIQTNLAQIYVCRGYVKEQSNQLDAALADFNNGIRLEPDLAEGYSYRGWLEQQQGNLDAAEADSFEAGKLDSSSATNTDLQLRYLGPIRYERHEFTNALADFHEVCELDPTDDYAHFDVWLCNSSLGSSERATEDLKAYLGARGSKDPGDWPSEVGRFLVGQITEQDFLSAAESADAEKDKEQHCEAYYYIGAKRLFAGDKAGAVAEFQKCLSTDVQSFNEYQFAKAELQTLEVGN